MKRILTVLSMMSLVITACSSGTSTQTTQPETPTPTVQPEATQTLKPQVQPPVTKPEVQPPTTTPSSGQTTPPSQSNSKPTPVNEPKTAEVQVDDLNVRSSPSTNSASQGTLPKGTQAKIIQRQGEWYYIVMGRVEGWVYGPYVKVLDGNPGSTTGNTGSKPTPVNEPKTAEVQIEGLNVRSAPNTSSAIQGALPKGTQAKIIQQQGDWYYIVMGRVEGWVYGPYVKVLEGSPGNITGSN